MEETEYHNIANPAMEQLLEYAEALEENHEVEAEYEEGVLTLTMPDGYEYVINKHTPSRQIWVSSPYSGAGYFEYGNHSWQPKRCEAAEGRDLLSFIKNEVEQHLA